MKPTEYKKPKLKCIKSFTFEDADACEFTITEGTILSTWFWRECCYQVDIEQDGCYDYCSLSPAELDKYFELYEQ